MWQDTNPIDSFLLSFSLQFFFLKDYNKKRQRSPSVLSSFHYFISFFLLFFNFSFFKDCHKKTSEISPSVLPFYLVPFTWYLLPFYRVSAPFILFWHLLLGILYFLSGIWHLLLGAWYLFYRVSGKIEKTIQISVGISVQVRPIQSWKVCDEYKIFAIWIVF